ncbi:hypothetical protein BA895_06840 [Humibacillus sp. DSM 29435]|nr:hypothetical protein BA895_06840 [Humibacillus sp. DSM 29435]
MGRTALADARVATLVTGGCPAPSIPTIVRVEPGAEAHAQFWLEPSSPTVARLSRWPMATLVVAAPLPFRTLALTGAVRSGSDDGSACRAFDLVPTSARLVGARAQAIRLEEFLGAEPDPLRREAAAILRHLAAAHAAELLGCLRAHGYVEAVAVVPRTLNRYGIELVALSNHGVQNVWLAFPEGPVATLHDVGPGLRTVLMCRCRSRQTE